LFGVFNIIKYQTSME